MNEAQGKLLLRLARESIAHAFGGQEPVRPADAPWLGEPGATFVSLHQKGDLRGCVGNIRPVPSLFESVVHNARAAAFDDNRFAPLAEHELPKTQLEVTVLTPPEPMPSSSEAEVLKSLRPGKDGVILSYGGRTSVFIPQMWEQLPDPSEFLFHLKRKAHFPLHWPDGMTAQRFTAEHWSES